jgi:hypothetical protein
VGTVGKRGLFSTVSIAPILVGHRRCPSKKGKAETLPSCYCTLSVFQQPMHSPETVSQHV